MRRRKSRGFTLIEILIVIGIIAVLAGIVVAAINPGKQFAQARNSQRLANVNAILSAVGQRMADNKGLFPGVFSVGGTSYTCGTLPRATSSVTTAQASSEAQETGALGCLAPTYIPALLADPASSSEADTGYTIRQGEAGRVTVCAPAAAAEASLPDPAAICVTR